ncbi:hypothetical protein [Thermococcus sp.]|uniref:hypothetical protein n=1 Tax=Thermococcus sp. TaxID=35749 RepID=UPI00262D4102|nr:hypothetical protein [Thermococcus sp.]
MKANKRIEIVGLVITSVALSILVGRKVLSMPGIPILAEQIETYTADNFWKVVYPTWNENTEVFSIADFPKLYLYAIIKGLSYIFGFSITIKLFLILPNVVAVLTAYYLVEYLILKIGNNNGKFTEIINRNSWIYLLLLTVSITYGFNPWIMCRSRNIILRWQYALTPLIIYLWMKILTEKKIKPTQIVAISAILALVETSRFIVKIGVPLAVYMLSYIVLNRSEVKKAIKRTILVALLFTSFVLPIYLPILYHSMNSGIRAVSVFNLDMVGGEKPINVFSLYFVHYIGITYNIPFELTEKFPYFFITISIISFIGLILLKRHLWIPLTTTVLFLITFIFSALKDSPFWFILSTAFGEYPTLGRLFRQPYHNSQMLPLYLIILLAYTAGYIVLKNSKKNRTIATIFMILVGVASLASSWPLLTGDLNGYWTPSSIPEDYINVNNLISNNTTYHALWIPEFWGRKAVWIKAQNPYNGPPTGIFAVRSSSIPSYDYQQFTFFNYYFPIRSPNPRYNLTYLGEYWDLIYGSLGIKYIIIHNDVKWNKNDRYSSELVEQAIRELSKLERIHEIYSGEYITVFEISNVSPPVLISGHPVIAYTGLTGYPPEVATFKKAPLVYREQYLNIPPLNQDIVLTYNDIFPSIFEQIKQKYIVSPRMLSQDYFKPKDNWTYIYSSQARDFIKYLIDLRPQYTFNFDYGLGITFTMAPNASISSSIHIEPGQYVPVIRLLKSSMGGLLKITIDNYTFYIDTNSTINSFEYIPLSTISFNSKGIKINIINLKGLNAINFIAFIPKNEYQDALNQRGKKHEMILYELTPNVFEQKDVIYETNKSSITGWQLKFTSPTGELVANITIPKVGFYKVKIQGDGMFSVKISNQTLIINTINSSSANSTLLRLSPGTDRIEITPYLGIQSLLPDYSFENNLSSWSSGSNKFTKELSNDSIQGNHSLMVYTTSTKPHTWSWIWSNPINVTPGKEYIIITHVKIQNTNGTHIPIVGYFENLHKWKQLRQCPTGRVGTGTFNWTEYKCIVKIPENVTKIRIVLNAGWVLDPSKGPAITWFDDIEVYPLDELPTIDSVWLYSVNNPNETLEDIFNVNETPATVQSYTKINPTLWKVKVSATKPFFLTFAESYDPLWEARVYKDGKLVEKVKPVPVYGVINGFWINQTGNLTIVLRYTPQDWFELGLKISLTMFILSMFYIIHDWRREKGDRWARKLEKIFTRAITGIKKRFKKVIGGVIKR